MHASFITTTGISQDPLLSFHRDSWEHCEDFDSQTSFFDLSTMFFLNINAPCYVHADICLPLSDGGVLYS